MEHRVIEETEKEIIRLQEELGKAKLATKKSQNELLIYDDTMKIDILGTEYRIEIHKVSEDSYMEKKRSCGLLRRRKQIDCSCRYVRRKIFCRHERKSTGNISQKDLKA